MTRGDVETLGGSDHRGVDRAERQVAIDRDQLGRARQIGGVELLDEQRAGDERLEQAQLRADPASRSGEMGHLGNAQRRNDQRSRMRLEQLATLGVPAVVRIEEGVQRARVDYERNWSASAARISSMRSATSVASPPAPAPTPSSSTPPRPPRRGSTRSWMALREEGFLD